MVIINIIYIEKYSKIILKFIRVCELDSADDS
jgi:hypothetical protein